MEEGVVNSTVVLAIITDDGGAGNAYFERPFCVQELQWAVTAGCFIQLVVDVADKGRIGELLSKAPGDLKGLIEGTDFIELIRAKMQFWAVSIDMITEVLLAKRLEGAALS